MIREQVVMEADCIRKLIVAEVSLFNNIDLPTIFLGTILYELGESTVN